MKKCLNILSILITIIILNSCNNKKEIKSEKSSKIIKSLPLKNNFDEEKIKKEGFQVFKNENFIIKCKGKILFDKARFENDQQSGQPNYSKPYHVFKNGVDYNINVSDMSSLLNGKDKTEINNFNNDDLKYYQTKFDEMGIKNEIKKFKGFDAVFYENTADGKLSKALYFHKDMKSYMLQVTSKSETKKLFEEFINTFELIDK